LNDLNRLGSTSSDLCDCKLSQMKFEVDFASHDSTFRVAATLLTMCEVINILSFTSLYISLFLKLSLSVRLKLLKLRSSPLMPYRRQLAAGFLSPLSCRHIAKQSFGIGSMQHHPSNKLCTSTNMDRSLPPPCNNSCRGKQVAMQ
jgi:hypothetical protein